MKLYEPINNTKAPFNRGAFLIFIIMESKKYQSRFKITAECFNLYKEESEKQFIINFFKELPVEKLKNIINFEIINPNDKTIAKTLEDAEYRLELMECGCIEYRAKMEL